MEGPLEEYKFKWEVVNATAHIKVPTKILYVRIEYHQQLFGFDFENMTLSFNDSTQVIDSINGYEMVDTAVDFYLKGKEIGTPIWYWVGLYTFVIAY